MCLTWSPKGHGQTLEAGEKPGMEPPPSPQAELTLLTLWFGAGLQSCESVSAPPTPVKRWEGGLSGSLAQVTQQLRAELDWALGLLCGVRAKGSGAAREAHPQIQLPKLQAMEHPAVTRLLLTQHARPQQGASSRVLTHSLCTLAFLQRSC